jgi:hypothetical protein
MGRYELSDLEWNVIEQILSWSRLPEQHPAKVKWISAGLH